MLGTHAHAALQTSTSAGVTTCTEDFNSPMSFSGGTQIPGGDGYLLLGPGIVLPVTSSLTITPTDPIASIRVSFWYATTGNQGSFQVNTGVLPSVSLTNTLPNNIGGNLAFTALNPGPGGASGDTLYDTGTIWLASPASGSFTLVFNAGATTLKIDDLQIAVTAVPEPGTYALMLAGLGVVGFVAARRRKPTAGEPVAA